MPRAIALALVIGAGATAIGCLPEPTTLDLSFQTERHFLYSDEVEIAMFNLAAGETGACSDLVAIVRDETGAREPDEYHSVPVCNLRNGGVVFEDIEEGRRVFVAVARDQFNHPLLTGCVEADTYVDAPEITLSMIQTENYTDYTEDIELGCANIDEKCSRGC